MPTRVVTLVQARNTIFPSQTPQTTQRYPSLVQASNDGTLTRTFDFPYPPTNVEYSNLTPEWVEIERPGYVPIVGLSKYKLMRIQFDFLVAVPWDGIWFSVEEELNTLRRMATGTRPVYFNNMGAVTADALPLPGTQRRIAGAGMFFRIVDFNIQSLRRNADNVITAAQCSIVLQEDFTLQIAAITMPAIKYPAIVKPVNGASTGGGTTQQRCTISSWSNCVPPTTGSDAYTKLYG